MNRVLLAGLTITLLGACNETPPSGPAAGKAYFSQVGCLACHRVGGEGSSGGPDLTLVGFRHSSAWLDLWMTDPNAWKPGTLMPNKKLSPNARAAIVSYMATLKGQDWNGAPPWSASNDAVERGRQIFLRAGCVACHGLGGVGGYPNNNVAGGKIPTLNRAHETYSKAELIAKIKNGVPAPTPQDPKAAAPLVFMPRWGDVLSAADLSAVADYILSLSDKNAEKTDW